jgi:hypothetical protein
MNLEALVVDDGLAFSWAGLMASAEIETPMGTAGF